MSKLEKQHKNKLRVKFSILFTMFVLLFLQAETKVVVEMENEAYDLFKAMMKLSSPNDPMKHHRILKGVSAGKGSKQSNTKVKQSQENIIISGN